MSAANIYSGGFWDSKACAVSTPDLELRLCLKQNPEETYILITLMERNCQKSARCQLYSSIIILTSLTNEVRFCVFRGNKSS